MLRTRSQSGRPREEVQFYKASGPYLSKKNYQQQQQQPQQQQQQQQQQPQQQQIQRTRSNGTVNTAVGAKGKAVVSYNREPENRAGSDETSKPMAMPASESVVAPPTNLDRFLESTTPSVPAQYLSKTRMRDFKTCDVEFQPYFTLGDLWESFKEWSAYGAGVPLILNGSDCVVQYYVPYLSGIQIYGDSRLSAKSRRPGEDTDGDYYRDSGSDGSSDCEVERGMKSSRELCNHHHLTSEVPLHMDRLSLGDKHGSVQEGFSSDDGEAGNSRGWLLFEFLEQDPPYSREPLADKISDLACRFPGLKTLRSYDLLPASWVSVAWYPIYRIPTGPTLRDLDACFLTFHSLSTPIRGSGSGQAPVMTYPNGMDGFPKISLPVFGLASYKFKGSMWTPNGGCERQVANSLLQAADSWLRLLQVNHPDFQFFASHDKLSVLTASDNFSTTFITGRINLSKPLCGEAWTMTIRTPATPASKIDRTPVSTPGGPKAKEEKIVVTVRLRPLSRREQSLKDQVAWECIDDHTIIFKPPPQERLVAPVSYSFDKVFGPACLTETVYEEGVKNVALSALMGINATIFAYGQTSSGKTYTMRGVTEKAVNDIYDHISNNPERDFTIKISGLEIYNENVRDLLNLDSARNLKLLDDPEKGTVVEKLVEETANNNQHLRHLISICETQRQVGETALNDTSSRSHQIIRLTIESTLRENSGCVKSFVASLNFVDLAGSERAAQTHADGARLREGCHINLSLMTLTTVIRKLSVGKRSGHIPYRDSKLTRILQHSLGGNARTAIICTLSPAFSHVEQSRNTLSFATRAKEVTNTAQVNMVVSEKQLLKNLQKEVARLEAELRTPDPSKEKDMKIQQMEMEIEELRRQRDLAQTQVDELRRKMQEQPVLNPFESPRPVAKCLNFSGSLSPKLDGKKSALHERTGNTLGRQTMRQSSTAPFTLMHEIRKLEQLQEQLGEEANRALEVLQKEVACHRLGNQDAAETIAKLQAEIREMRAVKSTVKQVEVGEGVATNKSVSANLKEEITRLHSQGSTIADLEEQLENVQKSIDKLVMSLPSNNQQYNSKVTPKSKSQSKKKKLLPLATNNSANLQNLIRSPCSPLSSSRKVLEFETENKAPENNDIVCSETSSLETEKVTPTKSEDGGDISSREETPCYRRSSSVNMRKMQKMFQNAAEENVRSIRAYVTELKERVAKLQYQKQLLVCQVLELEANEAAGYDVENDENTSELQGPPVSWHVTFQEQRKQIIELWDVCHVSIIHRTQFYLLFKGDPADQIYLEVELRRLTWLQQHFAELGNASPAHIGDDPTISLSSSIRALKREREFLAKRVIARLTAEERDALYIKWDVPLDGKQRKLQLVNKLWVDPHDAKHVEESAELVAKLVGFCEGGKVSKEMFELNFMVPADKRTWTLGWNPISNLLHL
ncbi:hypothetical protein NE237_019976 [Protea cynaroides]|uniref:Kinesin motor domain-containing protein n=1 Tax=Protea cynaroides TaxID=273540 RepID=A0A9Q0H548_9MAGN|nr:hypothetical protein NE237_019976 [Protea cynaroides]